ncbi:MAG: aminotransferase class III-fold pyridoxal phosphate-dependent enzyme [Candidatus Velthaea sp.]|jgi:taurine--2-oxoglutarate transaminase
MAISVRNSKTTHKRYVLTPWSAQAAYDAPVIVRGSGVSLYDEDGKRYIDASSGLIAVNLGHGHPHVVAAIKDQLDQVCYVSPALFNDRRAELAEQLAKLAPWHEGARVYYTTGGTDAVEDAVKIARTVSGRHKVLSGYRSFHGSSMGSTALTGENRRWANETHAMSGVVHFFAPYPYRSPFFTTDPATECSRALDHLKAVMLAEDPERIAALLIEPVVGSNGVIVYPEGYLAGVRQLCDEHGILLIFDEVMTGFGRVGAVFGGQRFGVVPDLMTFAKGVTSAYVPLGGVIVRENLAAYFDDRPMWLGHTYSGHPLAMAAGLATLEAYAAGNLFARAQVIETRLRSHLLALQAKHEIIGDVRGAGAFFALEFVSDRQQRTPLVHWQGKSMGVMTTLFASLRKRGVIAFGRYNIAHIAPPLIATDDDLAEISAALDGAIGDLAEAWSKAY